NASGGPPPAIALTRHARPKSLSICPMTLNLAVIGGDGTGPEVIDQALRVLDAAAKADGFDYATKTFDFGGEKFLATGHVLSDDDLATLKQYDAILLGAV